MSTFTPTRPSREPTAPVPLGMDDLRQLMRTVTETTQRLEHTHATLQREVTRLKGELAEANAQLHRSRELAALGEMAAGIAHEVRNPLASIGLYSQMLEEDLADEPEHAGVCGRISRAVERIDAIVRDVLRFARDTTIETRRTTARELIDETLEGCPSLLADGGIEIELDLPDDGLPLEADTTLIVQALGNLVRNAAEAMDEAAGAERTLEIFAVRQRRRVPGGGRLQRIVIGVRDRGPGLDPKIVERMFNPFFTTRHTGTGLGLAIVNRIVEAHGGHVAVANRPGGGATVELCLPGQSRSNR